MEIRVNDEERFRSMKDTFMVGYSSTGYYLAYSADGENFTPVDQECPANEVLNVGGATPQAWYKLSGNTGEVVVVI